MISKFKLDTAKSAQTKEAISQSLQIANSYAGELSIEVLPLDKIELDPENKRELALTLQDAMNGIDKDDPDYERKKQDWKSLESLAKSIQDGQLINPIFVYRYGNKCRLIAGERRTLASAIAGKKEVLARIAHQRPIGTKLRVLQWVENHERSELTLSERIASIESILQEYFIENKNTSNEQRVTAKLLSDLTAMSLTQARRYLLILNSSNEIRKGINEGKLENVKLIELICSVDDTAQQKKLLNEALLGKTFEEIVQLKKELESSQKPKKITRGRKRTNVAIGSVKPDIVRIIVDALVTSNVLKADTVKKLSAITGNIKWENTELIGKGFKKILSVLETEKAN